MLQKMSLEREPTPEPEEEDMESFLKRMAAEYVQTRKDPVTKKRSGFRATNEETPLQKTGSLSRW